MKIYFTKHKIDKGGLYMYNPGYQVSLRLAGAPKFIMNKYVEKYGTDEGIKKYEEFLLILKEILEEGHSPFVLYLYGQNNAN